jgi:ribosome maturation factor RimP
MKAMNGIQNSTLAREVVRSLQAMMTAVETGVLDTYPALLVAANMAFQDYIDEEKEQDDLLLEYTRQILGDAHAAWAIIQNIPQTGTRFMGGGFGLGGILLGSAISSGLNVLMDSADTKAAEREIAKARALWERATQALDKLKRYVLNEGTAPPPTLLGKPLTIKKTSIRRKRTSPPPTLLVDPLPKPRSRLAKYGLFFFWVIVGFSLIAALSELKKDNLQPLPPVQPQSNESATGAIHPQSGNVHVKPKPSQVPDLVRLDWDELRVSLHADYDRLRATTPDRSKEVIVKLQSGSMYKGYITALDDNSVSIEVSGQDRSMTIARQMCDIKTQDTLWSLPHRDIYVRQKLEAEFGKIKRNISLYFDSQIRQIATQNENDIKDIDSAQHTIAGDVMQVLNAGSVLLQQRRERQTVRIDGVKSGLVDGDWVNVQAYYVGTFDYINTLGAQSTVRRYSTVEPPWVLAKQTELIQLERRLNQVKQDKDAAVRLCQEKERQVLGSSQSSEFKVVDTVGVGFEDSPRRYDALYSFCATKFRAPIGRTITIQLKVGKLLKGEIARVDEENVSLKIGGATLAFPKEDLSETSRIACFKHDYAHFWATKKLAEERARQ